MNKTVLFVCAHFCVFSHVCFSGVLETDYPAGEELPVPQDLESGPVDGVSLTGSVASLGSAGSDGALATEGTTAVLQMAGAGLNDLPAQHSSGNTDTGTGRGSGHYSSGHLHH